MGVIRRGASHLLPLRQSMESGNLVGGQRPIPDPYTHYPAAGLLAIELNVVIEEAKLVAAGDCGVIMDVRE